MKTDLFAPDGTEPDEAAHSIDLRLDRELTSDEVSSIADAAFAEFALLEMEAAAEPHVVAGHYTVKDGRYVGSMDCPDCTRGLISRGHDMICIQVPARAEIRGKKPGDIVACGRPR
jgi:hypothetical protein